MYIPYPTSTNILLGVSALLGCFLVIFRESKPETRMGYSKFAPQDESTLKVYYIYYIILLFIYMDIHMYRLSYNSNSIINGIHTIYRSHQELVCY